MLICWYIKIITTKPCSLMCTSFSSNINHKKIRGHAVLASNSVVKCITDKLTHNYNTQQ